MSIKVGDHAPDFSLVGLGEGGPEVVTLSKITGEQNILILFVPMAFTGVCTQEFCAAMHIKTPLDNALYLSSLSSDLSM